MSPLRDSGAFGAGDGEGAAGRDGAKGTECDGDRYRALGTAGREGDSDRALGAQKALGAQRALGAAGREGAKTALGAQAAFGTKRGLRKPQFRRSAERGARS